MDQELFHEDFRMGAARLENLGGGDDDVGHVAHLEAAAQALRPRQLPGTQMPPTSSACRPLLWKLRSSWPAPTSRGS